MASINFNEFKKGNTTTLDSKDYVYTDIHLDIRKNSQNSDIRVDYDINAIKNSIFNIFNTIPGERYLIPTFGCNLMRYLFQPISEITANAIGQTILSAIRDWEPRVKIQNINIIGVPDDHEYAISFELIFPVLKRNTKVIGVLSKKGFREV